MTGVDLPSEESGRIPDAAWKESYFKDLNAEQRAWNAGDMTNIAIGQGDILVTPLQMATAYCGLAMGGVEWTPHVLLSAVARDGEGDSYIYEKRERLTAEIKTPGAMDVVYRGVHTMIYDESPVTAAHFTNLPVQVAGKSGTGEKNNEDPYGLQMAIADCGLAMGGVEWTPHVLLSAVARDGEGDSYIYEKKERLTAEIKTSGAMDVVYRGVHTMIYDESPVTAAHFTNLPVQVAGKSGTGETPNEDPSGWFIASAPFEEPKYVVCAMLERGGYGSTCAMTAVRTVLGAIYDAHDDKPFTVGDSTR